MIYIESHEWYFILDVDECSNATLNDCHGNATCTDTEGTYMCMCNDGYTGDGVSCDSTFKRFIYLLTPALLTPVF